MTSQTSTAAEAASSAAPVDKENFEELLNESFGDQRNIEGSVVRGVVVSVEGDTVIVDVGLKSEGRVPIKELTSPGQEVDVSPGDELEVYVERMEDRSGQAVLSREKARREEAWGILEASFEKQERVTGMISAKVKGGFTVDLSGATAFLPGSQIDIRPVREHNALMNTPQPFQILKIDRRRGNIVVSRRAVLEESRAEARSELVSNLKEGQVLQGIVKNITDYGAFVDLGGVDGLLHVTDIAWKRINHPSEALQVGETVEVQVIRFNPETQRISLGMKQLLSDPWEDVESKFQIGTRMEGRVTNITDYGAFVELADGVEGLVHISEMSWTKKNVHPGKIVSTSQQVEVKILDIDLSKRRISLGLKQCNPNPWEEFNQSNEVDKVVEGSIRNITEFGLFVGLTDEIDGLVHLSDISWEVTGEAALEGFKKGDTVKAKILEVDIDKERISLGIKQLSQDPFAGIVDNYRKGEVVTCTVTALNDAGIEVRVGEALNGFIRRGDLSRDRAEQRSDRFAVDEKVDALITNIDKKTRKLSLSIKAREEAEEKQAVEEYGSTDSGASLGDILGAALAKRDSGKDSGKKAKAKADADDGAAKDAKADAGDKAAKEAKADADDGAAEQAKADADDEAKADADDGAAEEAKADADDDAAKDAEAVPDKDD